MLVVAPCLSAQVTPGAESPAPLPEAPAPTSPAANPSPKPAPAPCTHFSRLSRFVDGPCVLGTLTPSDKAELAVSNMVDPGNLAALGLSSGFTVGVNSHTAYGPGWPGFGRATGYGFVQEATGQFFGTWVIPSLNHEDPRYHRLGTGSVQRRLGHALVHTFVDQHDDGRREPNVSTLLTYPISAEISNLYVPGLSTNLPSTAIRVLVGYATNPVDDVISEFLPDVARHIHVHVVIIQRILNRISNNE